jgi:hypothetical protein
MHMKTFLLSLSLISLGGVSAARAADLAIDAHSKYSGYSWSELGIKTLVLTAKQDFSAVGHENISGSGAKTATGATGSCAFQQNGITNITRGTTLKYSFTFDRSYNGFILVLQPLAGDQFTKTGIRCNLETGRSADDATLDDIGAFLEAHFTVQAIGTLN